jgi:malic enzyme
MNAFDAILLSELILHKKKEEFTVVDKVPTKEELLAKAFKPSEDAMRLHPFYGGKLEVSPKCCIRDFNDFAIWYTPGAAAEELAKCAEDRGLSADSIIPKMDEPNVYVREAVAVGMKAIEQNVARKILTRNELYRSAELLIYRARKETEIKMRERIIIPAI